LQWVAVSCSELQWVAVSCSELQRVAVSCSELQWVAVSCNVLQWVAVSCSELQWVAVSCSELQYGGDIFEPAMCCSALQWVEKRCSKLQWVAVWWRLYVSCSELQWVAVSCSVWIVHFAPLSWIQTYCVKWAQYGVATTSRIKKITCLFCRISSLLWGSFAKETYSLIDATKISHPILDPYYLTTNYGVATMSRLLKIIILSLL